MPTDTQTPSIEELCGYYLACLSFEKQAEVSVWARSKYDLEYAYVSRADFELAVAPDSDPEVRRIIKTANSDRGKQAYLGYLVYLDVFQSQRGNTIYRANPLLVRSLDRDAGDHVYLNVAAMTKLLGSSGPAPLEEIVDLEQHLGLDSAVGAQTDFGKVIAKLQEAYPGWAWRLEIPEPDLSALEDPGIYDRAVVFVAEAPKYTIGLENDLAEMRKLGAASISDSILERWLTGHFESNAGPSTLLEPLPLNSEQRTAVQSALVNSMTVITGPPGTGKSQVVSAILINAAYRGMSVLFASKNNRAVDVVEERVNALGPRPVLLRLGAADYQGRLAEYLSRLVAGSVTEADRSQHRALEAEHQSNLKHFSALDTGLKEVVELRNRVDAVEQEIEELRKVFPTVQDTASIDVNEARAALGSLVISLSRSWKQTQPLPIRLIWPFVRGRRHADAIDAVIAITPVLDSLRLGEQRPNQQDTAAWTAYVEQCHQRLDTIERAQQYLALLDQLADAPSPEDLAADRSEVIERIGSSSHEVWQAWLRVLPDRLDADGRRTLGQYQSLLGLMDGSGARKAATQLKKLLPEVVEYLPCWAVTSLSTRGRIPLAPGFFDLVVIDEASQCDIASALPLLARARRAVVIGDPMQLRHVTTIDRVRDEQLLDRHGLLEHLGWAYSTRSLFDLAASIAGGGEVVGLRDHHRSHADIIEFSNKEFYEGRLRVATRYQNLKRAFDGPAIRWIHTPGKVQRPASGSALNMEEARGVVAELGRLADQGYEGSVGVVTPFRAQADRIRDLASGEDSLRRFLQGADFRVGAAHSFQGDERDVMIFSPVIAEGAPPGALRFVSASGNLFNVAITRARASLVVVGDESSALIDRIPHLMRFRDYVATLDGHRLVVDDVRAAELGPQYPAIENNRRVSEWERALYEELYRNGIRTIPQVPVENYILDLAMFIGNRKLDIEVDGEHYHRAWDGELAIRDQLRSQRLIELGWDVMRFWVYQIRDDLPGCVARVRRWVEEASASEPENAP